MNNLVSVITPAYNSEKYISMTIESVIKQTYDNWEMIIVDDCSTDNTESIVKQYCLQEKRIRYFRLNENSGAAVARNTALKMSKGKYIAFLDSDDQWKSDKLNEQLRFMRDNLYGFTFTEYEIITEDGQFVKNVNIPKKINYEDILKNTIIGCLTVIIDKEIIGDFSMPNVRKGQDTMTWVSILRKGHTAYGLQKNLSSYRLVNNSLSNSKIKALMRTWNNYRYVEKLPLLKCLYYYLFYVFNAFKKHYIK